MDKNKKGNEWFNDTYIDCPNDTINKLYTEKGCIYIQISNKGLYHLGSDLCDFKVPEFICDQQLRVRTKIHTRKNNNGFCKLSVTVACQPKNIKKLIPSEYSLDDKIKLPNNLVFTLCWNNKILGQITWTNYLEIIMISDDNLDVFIPYFQFTSIIR